MARHPWGAVAELAAAQHGVVSRSQAAEADLTPSLLRPLFRRGIVDEPFPGVLRVTAAPASWEQALCIATLGVAGVVSHRAAAVLHGLLPRPDRPLVEVLVVGSRRRSCTEFPLHRARELDRHDVTTVAGIAVTNVARTLCDLGAVASDDVVEQALDEALRRGCSLRWIHAALRRLDRPGPSGTGSLRRVLARPDRRGVVPGSWRERVTARLLDHPELRPLVAQHEIRDEAGRLVARPDLAVVDARVGIEYHSDQWHHGPRRGRRDRRRDLAAARAGWQLLYLDATDHRDPAAALAAVLDVVRLRRREQRNGRAS